MESNEFLGFIFKAPVHVVSAGIFIIHSGVTNTLASALTCR